MPADGPPDDAPVADRVLLLIADDRNRALLAERIGDSAEVLTAGDDPFDPPSFDLCLVDGPSLRRHRKRLATATATAAPTFLPVCLLAGDGSLESLSAAERDVVDEVIGRPVSAAELEMRVENLRQRRRLSRQLTREKERSERRFETLFESTPDPVVVVDPDGTVTEANDAFGRAFGLDPEAVTGRQVGTLTPDESVERVLLRVDGPETETTTVEWNRGSDPLVTELNASAVAGLDDAAERIGIFRDVTRRVNRERDLERRNDRLEEFAGTVAHDLRGPLQAARAELDIARMTDDADGLGGVEDALDRMDEMVGELLSLAKQGQVVADPAPVSLDAAVETAWDRVQAPDATLERDVEGVVEADPGRLSELFENLLHNAVDHGGADVTVRVGRLPDGFYVADDGPGVPADERDRVFDTGYTDSADGTGFGLAIVRQIAEGHGWTVRVTESDDGGARFEVTGVDVERAGRT